MRKVFKNALKLYITVHFFSFEFGYFKAQIEVSQPGEAEIISNLRPTVCIFRIVSSHLQKKPC